MLATYSIDETAGRLLDLAVDAWRRYEQARSTLDEAGLTVEVDGRTVARPEVAIERDARAAFQRLLNQLGLDSAGEPEERSAKA